MSKTNYTPLIKIIILFFKDRRSDGGGTAILIKKGLNLVKIIIKIKNLKIDLL